MGLDNFQKRERESSEKLKNMSIVSEVEDNDDFVFISYKSDDWKNVLEDKVYNLQKQFGLRVYFDRAFEQSNDYWVPQMKTALKNPNCKAMLVFVSEAYMTSSATLLELLQSQEEEVGELHDGHEIPKIVVTVPGGQITDIYGLTKKTIHTQPLEIREFERECIIDLIGQNGLDTNSRTRNLVGRIEKEGFTGFRISSLIQKVLPENTNIIEYNHANFESTIVERLKKYGFSVFDEQLIEKTEKNNPSGGSRPEKKRSVPTVSARKTPDQPVVKPLPTSMNVMTEANLGGKGITLGTVRKLFSENDDFCQEIRDLRKTGLPSGAKSYMDYGMAALLGGCNNIKEDYQLRYYIRAVKKEDNVTDMDKPGSTYTWSSNARKVTGFSGSGQIDAESNKYFSEMDPETTVAEIIGKFHMADEKAFVTKKNELVITALTSVRNIAENY